MTYGVIRHAKALADLVPAKGLDDGMGKFAHAATMTKFLSSVKTGEAPYRQISCHAILDGMEDKTRPFADIAARIRWHRALESLDQETYARKAGLTRQQLNNWESGSYRLSIDGALALRRTYGLSLDFMYEGIDDALAMTLRRAWRERPEVSASK
jgi:DNA-binding XRE family transcriptional regulator